MQRLMAIGLTLAGSATLAHGVAGAGRSKVP
jgi:hypothetical protein